MFRPPPSHTPTATLFSYPTPSPSVPACRHQGLTRRAPRSRPFTRHRQRCCTEIERRTRFVRGTISRLMADSGHGPIGATTGFGRQTNQRNVSYRDAKPTDLDYGRASNGKFNRKNDVWGKGGYVRCDLGGSRTI